jgi:hypothetical protein
MNAKNVLITGDITLDHYVILGYRKYSDSAKNKTGSCYSTIKGGAYLIYEFLKSFEKEGRIVFGLNPEIYRKLPPQNNSFASISLHMGGHEGKDEIWRIDNQFGFGSYTKGFNYRNSNPKKDLSGYDLVIIDDAGMDFSSHANQKKVWPLMDKLVKSKNDSSRTELIICKKSGDIKKGEFWKELLAASENGEINLLSIVSITDIRRQDARVSTKISWEQSALDLVYEIKNNINLADLQKSKYVIVTFGASGAILILNKGAGAYEYKLIFDPVHLEDEWEKSHKGTVIGRMSCFTAALAHKLDLSRPDKDYFLDDAIIAGLQSLRGFFDTGYIYAENEIKLPLGKITAASKKHENTFTWANIPAPGRDPGYLEKNWTILLDNYEPEEEKTYGSNKTIFDLARHVAVNGPKALVNVPSLSLRKLFTVDRNEIESLRNIKKLIENYNNQKGAGIPLSLAVFGLPGSGKSFGVKEIGKGVLGPELPILEFNLSQFAGPGDLIGAFHQVRDEVLKGTTPLVFWDEFDSREYKWLQFLLAPMQDGTFQEGQVTHTIGKCIMVFAGGTSYKMEMFGNFDETKEPEKYRDFKLKKGPDFISRINGYINILGPNPGIIKSPQTGKWDTDKSDICYPLRRALFIRQILGLKDDKTLDIDWGLLNSLLKVDKYKHGARSLTFLLKNLKENSDGRKILRCHLPSNVILKLYIDNLDDFLKNLTEYNGYYENAFKIAPSIHQVWMEKSVIKNPAYEKEFNMLPVFIKASNIDAAIRIPKVLGMVKLKIVPRAAGKVMTNVEYLTYIQADNNKFLECMSEEEHNLWTDFYLSNDWKYNEKRNDYRKHHNCLVNYNDSRLSEQDRKKDRDQVKKYWEFLNEVGFGIVKE